MATDWERVDGSTIVAAARYDEAARRIFVQTHRGLVRGFEDCSSADWASFMSDSTSKGEYLTRVLSRKAEVGGQAIAPRPTRTQDVSRAVVLNAFSPAQELDEPSRFAGRRDQILAVADALQTRGSVPMVFGDRGLGKSSIAVQAQLIAMGDQTLLNHLQASSHAIPQERSFLTVFVACSDEIRNVDGLLQALINAAEDVVPDEEGSAPNMLVDRSRRTRVSLKVFETETTKRFGQLRERLSYENLGPAEKLQRVSRLLNEAFDSPVLYVIDELDRVQDKKGLASVVKRLSTDYVKFMLVGIAQDWSDLMLDHASLERHVTPIRVPRMTSPELAEVVDLASDYLDAQGMKLSFTPRARTRLVQISGGFPWFVHVVGQAALIDAFDRAAEKIDEDFVIRAMRGLVKNQFAQHFADTYQMAVRDSYQREIVLRAFAEWNSTDIPTSAIFPVAKELGVGNPSIYLGHLCGDSYGAVLMRPGFQDRGLVRFRNEMFKQYVFLASSLYSGVDSKVRETLARRTL